MAPPSVSKIIIIRMKITLEQKINYSCNSPRRPIGLVRRQRSHVFYTIGSQMAVRLSALHTGLGLSKFKKKCKELIGDRAWSGVH
jgi:hypothetical protein